MKYLRILFLLSITVFLSACSFSYKIVIINDSDKPIEVLYKVGEKGRFDDLYTKSVEDWKIEKSIRRLWTEEKPWQLLSEGEYTTN